MNTIANAVSQNGSIVDIEMFRRCESEEQLLDAPGDIGKKRVLSMYDNV